MSVSKSIQSTLLSLAPHFAVVFCYCPIRPVVPGRTRSTTVRVRRRVCCLTLFLGAVLVGGTTANADTVDDATRMVLSDRSIQTSFPQRVQPPLAQPKPTKNPFGLPWWPFSQRSSPTPPPLSSREAPARTKITPGRAAPSAQAQSETSQRPAPALRALPAPSVQTEPDATASERRAIARVVFLAVVCGLVAFLLIWLFKQIRLVWRTRDPRVKSEKRKTQLKVAESSTPRRTPLQRAEDFARQDRYLEAAQSLAYGALECAASAPFGFSVTPREVVAGLAVSAEVRAALHNLVTVVERGHFGARSISRDDYLRCLSDFHRVSEAELGATMRS